MSHYLFERHQATLESAVRAVKERGYWSAYSEVPSTKIYGDTASEEGKTAFDALLGKPFALKQSATIGQTGAEISPYGTALNILYPKADQKQLLIAAQEAASSWRLAGPEIWSGVALEILQRLNRRSFEMAHAVMHTTGQAFMMAFQAGGPHAQDRGLEAVAYAWEQMSQIPATARWEKPQGKNPALLMRKNYHIVPRGIGLVIGCCTFPTWNSYPGLFANLATGNAVIVKPHPGAILPLAITVAVAREVLQEAGLNPDVVTLLAHDADDQSVFDLITHPSIGLIDFTGSTQNGNLIERSAHQAQVFTEKAGVNQIIVDSTDDYRGMLKNIAFSLSLYSGQMCTAPQNIYIPKAGIDTSEGHRSFDQVVGDLADSVRKLTADPARAVEVLGAIQNAIVLNNIYSARSCGEVILDSQPLVHPLYPDARIHTPLLVKITDQNDPRIQHEYFGPVAFCISTESSYASINLAETIAKKQGALTLSVYSINSLILADAEDAAVNAGVALSINLTGGVFVNQSAAFSDYHGSGANPAANATLSDTAFVANRFRVVQTRRHIAASQTEQNKE